MAELKDRKMDILQAAISVFSQKGFHEATIDDIAAEAKIAKGTIYLYFSSKNVLFKEMIRYSIMQYHDSIIEELSSEMSVEKKLLLFAEFHGNFITEHIDLAHAMISSQSILVSKEMKTMILEQKERMYTLVEKIVEDGISKGEVRTDINKEIAAFSILGTINDYYIKKIFNKKTEKQHIDPIPVVDFLVKALN